MYHLLESWKLLDWKFPCRDILTESRRLIRSIMFSMGKAPSQRTSANLVKKSKEQQTVEVVEALGTPPSLVERVRKFQYLQTFAGDVAKGDIKKNNLVKQWKQCVGTVP